MGDPAQRVVFESGGRMRKLAQLACSVVVLLAAVPSEASAVPDRKVPVTVGVTSVLSGDLGVLGRNIVDTVETYKKYYSRHDLNFVYEDAKLSSVDGLKAYQSLINSHKAGFIIGACTSNGTMAAKSLINSSRVPTITVVTGGKNIDAAGPYIFRIGNSDTLNGIQEAEAFIAAGTGKAALLTEETEYTQDISEAFRGRFAALGGTLVFDGNFIPGTVDFRTDITRIKQKSPDAIFMPTQTGTALGVFLKQWNEQGGSRSVSVHTTFVAAPNPEAHTIAGELIEGVYYMAPRYDRHNPRLKEFFSRYRQDHGRFPPIAFHTAGTVDSLDLLQKFLDKTGAYSGEGFHDFLLNEVKDYQGLMGTYSFDPEGNARLGFELARITKESRENMQ